MRHSTSTCGFNTTETLKTRDKKYREINSTSKSRTYHLRRFRRHFLAPTLNQVTLGLDRHLPFSHNLRFGMDTGQKETIPFILLIFNLFLQIKHRIIISQAVSFNSVMSEAEDLKRGLKG
jgi:hypothetical protein